MVVDASALVALLTGEEAVADAMRVALRRNSGVVSSPELLDLEVITGFRQLIKRRDVPAELARQAVSDLRTLSIRRLSHAPLVERVWELRHNLTAYDAAYLALAETLGATLLTLDRGLAAVPARTVEVVPVDPGRVTASLQR